MSYRIITGCLRPTEVHQLHTLSGIATPDIRRTTISEIERYKICNQDSRHPQSCGKAPQIETKFHVQNKRRLPDYKTRKTEYVKERIILQANEHER